MFRYGKKSGYMVAATLLLAFVPLMVAMMIIPGLAETVPMKIGEGGEVLRWGSRWELLTLPIMCAMVSLAIVGSAFKQARAHAKEPVMAQMAYERFARNGLITATVLNVLNGYLFFTVMTGHGIGF